MIESRESRDSQITLRVDGRWLHSGFNPEREARRFVDTLEIGSPRLILLLGAGGGYILRALSQRFPQARIVPIFLRGEIREHAISLSLHHWDCSWTPEDSQSFSAFLPTAISELEALSVAVVEWPSGVACEPSLAQNLGRQVASFVRKAQGSILSAGAQGPQRLRNAILNAAGIRGYTISEKPTRAVRATVVTAAGPTLEKSIHRIHENRSEILLIATGSSVAALTAAGLRPDLLVVTESSVYGAMHLRGRAEIAVSDVPLLAPLTVSTSTTALASQSVFFSQGELGEAFLSHPPALHIPPLGSVTLSALAIARALSPAPIVIAGLDLAWLEQRSHVRPHLAHDWHQAEADKMNPHSARGWDNMRGQVAMDGHWSQDRSLRTYADWIGNGGLSSLKTLYALSPSPLLKPFVAEIPTLRARELGASYPARYHARKLNRSPRMIEHAHAVLDRWEQIVVQTPTGRVPTEESLSLLSALAIKELVAWARDSSCQRRATETKNQAHTQIQKLHTIVDHVAA